jgi:hypothetical protein
MRSSLAVLLAVVAVVSVGGCAKARMVEVTQDGGVVAIPSNTNRWPNYYRNQAEELMKQKCPDGFEIVEEEEFVTGQVAHTESRTKTQEAPSLDLAALQRDTHAEEQGSASLAGLSIPLGRTDAQTDATTNYRDVTEYRIRFRPKTPR